MVCSSIAIGSLVMVIGYSVVNKLQDKQILASYVLAKSQWITFVAQYADIGPESATNRARFGSGPVPGRHPILGGGIGGLRQLGAEPVH